MLPATAIVHKVNGEVVEFAGWSAKFIVAHPRLSFWIGVGLGLLVGRLIFH